MRLSFRVRIAAFSGLVSGGVLLLFGTAAWYLLVQQKVEGLDTEIRALGNRHPGWLASRSNFDRFEGSLQFIFGDEHKGQIIFLVKDAGGRVLYRSPDWPRSLAPDSIDCSLHEDPTTLRGLTVTGSPGSQLFESPLGRGRGGIGRGLGPGRAAAGGVVFTKVPRFKTVTAKEGTWRLGIMGNNDLRLVVGLSYESVKSELSRFRNGVLVAIPLALILVAAGGWWVSGRALGPLKSIAATAEQVTAQGLHQRVPATHEDPELQHLIQVLNRMMDRLEVSFHQATRFSADASHELKTPLAVMQGELENAVQNTPCDSPEQRVFASLLEETQHLKRIIGSLLLLSQADAGQLKLAAEDLSLSDELKVIVEDARILAADSGVEFKLAIEPGVKVHADRSLLRMALLNLVKNALVYNAPRGSVEVSLCSGSEVTVTVTNTGPGIPPQDQARIFDRFYRGTAGAVCSRDGLGLGLSLSREILRAHQGKLELRESRPGFTCFVASLKAAAGRR